ncbi:MAG: dephospho-CoA kinase [Lentimicrobiaceae bacterium]|nr:dephospho-CoA kinase [Lentimicrobiaceae bacterium]
MHLQQKKIRIALTGGIGIGKTYISKHFLDMGIPVFYADEEAKKLYDSEKVLTFFKENFGDTVFSNQKLDFAKLATLVFGKQECRKQIEAFIHPLVMQQFEYWSTQQDSNIVMLESAIVFEASLEKFFDKIIVVDAPIEVRIQRIKNRNPHMSESEILRRINLQIPQEEKCKRADFVIDNSGF